METVKPLRKIPPTSFQHYKHFPHDPITSFLVFIQGNEKMWPQEDFIQNRGKLKIA